MVSTVSCFDVDAFIDTVTQDHVFCLMSEDPGSRQAWDDHVSLHVPGDAERFLTPKEVWHKIHEKYHTSKIQNLRFRLVQRTASSRNFSMLYYSFNEPVQWVQDQNDFDRAVRKRFPQETKRYEGQIITKTHALGKLFLDASKAERESFQKKKSLEMKLAEFEKDWLLSLRASSIQVADLGNTNCYTCILPLLDDDDGTRSCKRPTDILLEVQRLHCDREGKALPIDKLDYCIEHRRSGPVLLFTLQHTRDSNTKRHKR